jgi:hypothetical protein
MGLIEGVALFDVASCEAFIQRALDKSQIRYEPEEREELLALGWVEFFELACKYKPLPEPPCGYGSWFAMTLDDRQTYEARLHADTKVKRGRFSGHAAMFFPRRFGDAWHKSHPEHRYVTDRETGKRRWTYGAPMVSLDGLLDINREDPDEHQLLNARTINAFCHATISKLGLSRIASARAAR